MTWILRQIVLGLHILFAIIWVGGLFFVGWGIFLGIRKMKFVLQREILLNVIQWSHPLFTMAGLGVIVSGVVLGTVLGPIKQWGDIWNTTYGNLWITAFIVAVISLYWGGAVGYKWMAKILNDKHLWMLADREIIEPLIQALILLVLIESIEPMGFAVLIMIMVLL